MMRMDQSFKALLFFVLTLVSLSASAGTTLYYLHDNQLGAPVVATDQAQQVVWQVDRTPFGDESKEEVRNRIQMPLALPGQYTDRETGFNYNYYRDYDPSLGRYVESDPIGLHGGVNTYLFTNGNPVIYVDPNGHTTLTLGGAVGGAGEGAVTTGGSTVMDLLGPVGAAVGALLPTKMGDGTLPPQSNDGTASDKPKSCPVPNEKKNNDDICYSRWESEDSACNAWSNLGARAVAACKRRAADRRNLCVANGGEPNPLEPPEYDPFVDYPR